MPRLSRLDRAEMLDRLATVANSHGWTFIAGAEVGNRPYWWRLLGQWIERCQAVGVGGRAIAAAIRDGSGEAFGQSHALTCLVSAMEG